MDGTNNERRQEDERQKHDRLKCHGQKCDRQKYGGQNDSRWIKRGMNISFRLRTTLILVGMIAVIVVSMAGILSNYFKEKSMESIRGAIDMAVSVNAGEVKRLVERVESSIDVIHDNDDLYLRQSSITSDLVSMICKYERLPDNSDLYGLNQLYDTNTERITNLFEDCFDGAGVSHVARVFVDKEYPITKWLNHTTGLEINEKIFVDNQGVETEDWYQQTKQLDGEVYWFTLPENESWLYLAKVMKYRYVEDMNLVEERFAVFAVGFETAWIAERINASAVTENACIWITDCQNKVIYASDQQRTAMFSEIELAVMDDTVSHIVNEDEYLIQKTDLNGELFMFIAVPMEDISNMNAGMAQVIVMVAVAILITGILLAAALSIYVAKPIGRLADHMQSGKMETIEFVHKEDDEVSVLYASFNHLIGRLKEMFQNVVEASEKKKQAEIRALQSQINPHFFYNTLNSIASVELLSGRQEVADVISYLSQMLRYSIKNPNRMVTLADEVRNIQCYTRIQQFCYRNLIRFEYEIAPESEVFLLPKVIIQPLVENSLIHGTNIIESDAQIRLSSSVEGEFVVIRVWDNGTDADVERINRYLRGQEEFEKGSDSLGIRNVYERIRMLYGESGDLIYEKDQDGCTVAMIRLPVVESPDKG